MGSRWCLRWRWGWGSESLPVAVCVRVLICVHFVTFYSILQGRCSFSFTQHSGVDDDFQILFFVLALYMNHLVQQFLSVGIEIQHNIMSFTIARWGDFLDLHMKVLPLIVADFRSQTILDGKANTVVVVDL